MDRCGGGLPWDFRGQVRVGEEPVSFAARLGAEPFGLFGGFEVVGEGRLDVLLPAQPGGVPSRLGLLGTAQGGRAG